MASLRARLRIKDFRIFGELSRTEAVVGFGLRTAQFKANRLHNLWCADDGLMRNPSQLRRIQPQRPCARAPLELVVADSPFIHRGRWCIFLFPVQRLIWIWNWILRRLWWNSMTEEEKKDRFGGILGSKIIIRPYQNAKVGENKCIVGNVDSFYSVQNKLVFCLRYPLRVFLHASILCFWVFTLLT